MATIQIDDSYVYSPSNLTGIQHVYGEWSSIAGGASNGRYRGTYTENATPGGLLFYAFRGSAIGYSADNNLNNSLAFVSLDGRTHTRINATGTIGAANGPYQRQWWSASGLGSGDHQLAIVSNPSNNITFGLDFFTVTPLSGSSDISPKNTGPGATDVPAGALIVDNESDTLVWAGASWRRDTALITNSGYFNGSEHCTTSPGASGSLTFTGTGVWYFVDNYDNNARVNVSIDGQFRQTVSTAGANGTSLTQKLVWGTSGLSPGTHEITLTHAGSSSPEQWACVDFFMYLPINTTTQPSPAPTPTAVESSGSSKSSPAGPIAGGVVGGVVLLALLAGLFVFLRKRRSKQAGGDAATQHETYTGQATYEAKQTNPGYASNYNPPVAYQNDYSPMGSPGYKSGGSTAPTSWTGPTYQGHPEL